MIARTERKHAEVTYNHQGFIQFIELEDMGFYGRLVLVQSEDKPGIFEAFVEKKTFDALAELAELERKRKQTNADEK